MTTDQTTHAAPQAATPAPQRRADLLRTALKLGFGASFAAAVLLAGPSSACEGSKSAEAPLVNSIAAPVAETEAPAAPTGEPSKPVLPHPPHPGGKRFVVYRFGTEASAEAGIEAGGLTLESPKSSAERILQDAVVDQGLPERAADTQESAGKPARWSVDLNKEAPRTIIVIQRI